MLALVVTLYGLANVMPAIGDFRIGPFPMVFFRASFFALCVLVVALGLKRTGKPWFDGLMDLLALAATAMLMWACVKYYYVGIEIDEAMFLFVPTDVALLFLGATRRRQYARIRVGMIAAVSALCVVGVFKQPLWVPALTLFLPMALLAFDLPPRRSGPAPVPTGSTPAA